jgi:hypothetical protein
MPPKCISIHGGLLTSVVPPLGAFDSICNLSLILTGVVACREHGQQKTQYEEFGNSLLLALEPGHQPEAPPRVLTSTRVVDSL